MDPIHPRGFTHIYGQSSKPPQVILEIPPLSAATFIPMVPISGVEMSPLMTADVGAGKTVAEYHNDVLKEQLRAIEGTYVSNYINPVDLCLVPKVVLPPKFKVPEFEKLDRTQYPQTHLRLYCQAMAAYFDNEKLTMHYFRSSLTGTMAKWYIHQDRTQICTWGDLATAFVVQYRHIMDMASNQMALLEMRKKSTETFKEYAYRWQDLAVQVDPSVGDQEVISLFVSTLKDPY
ncbi:uncharacterized protein LOC131166700 [Malania oleifera]|uniref:uncharacterized protein LOC131166700 n=1 Tax=Malania oleifera TaxID=397392 RepID=UPI0025AE63B9|nr:uncharacterized protein LOC131166700 [Malania oleifera]